MQKARKSFTLAEVLITLGIVGIAVAIILPTTIVNYKNKALANQAKNSYSKLSNGLLATKSRLGIDSYAELFNSGYTKDTVLEELSKDLKIVKICKEHQGGCWNWKTKYAKKRYSNGKAISLDYRKQSGAVLSDGSVIFLDIYPHDGNCNWTNSVIQTDSLGNPIKDENGNNLIVNHSDKRCGSIKIDINGAKGPNQLGADTWDIDVYPDKLSLQYYSLLYDDNLNYENYQIDED
ncbi:MAG: type II secretion system protein [Candidatus Gastranaerophilaceae bacterium]